MGLVEIAAPSESGTRPDGTAHDEAVPAYAAPGATAGLDHIDLGPIIEWPVSGSNRKPDTTDEGCGCGCDCGCGCGD